MYCGKYLKNHAVIKRRFEENNKKIERLVYKTTKGNYLDKIMHTLVNFIIKCTVYMWNGSFN